MSSPLADRLMAACWDGDLPSVQAAVADGASVNQKETELLHGLTRSVVALAVAAEAMHHDVVVWLLSQGADPNGDTVMCNGALDSTATILQLLIAAGGDVNDNTSCAEPLLFWAIDDDREDSVRLLLAQPALDLTVMYAGQTPEEYARTEGLPAVADLIAQEVNGQRCSMVVWLPWSRLLTCWRLVLLIGRRRDERRWYDWYFCTGMASLVWCEAADMTGVGVAVVLSAVDRAAGS